jgi:hypothetical protein
MRQATIGAALLTLTPLLGLAAQNPPGRPPDSGVVMPRRQFPMRPGEVQPRQRRGDPQEIMRLQEEVRERMSQRIQQELNLNDQQMDRLRTVTRSHEDRMRDLARRDEDLHRAVRAQLQPGVGANQDSLGRLLDALAANQVTRAQAAQQEMRELSQFLTPVQRARLLFMRRQFEERVRQIRERFRPGMEAPGPGAGPGPLFEEPDPPHDWEPPR